MHFITSWSLIKNYTHFTQSEGFIVCLERPANNLYPERHESSSDSLILCNWDPL